MEIVLLLIAGFCVGIMNAVAGGGILLGFPVLLATGMNPLIANATANVVVLPGLLSSAFGYRKYIRKVPRRYWTLLVPCATGALIGALLLRNTANSDFEKLVPWLIVSAVALFALQPQIKRVFGLHTQKGPLRLRTLAWFAILILPLSIYGGYFGAGFGFIMLAVLSFTHLSGIHQMNGLKNLTSSTIAIVSIVVLSRGGLIDWRHGLIMALGSLVGGYTGAQFAQKVPSHLLRITVIVIGALTAGYIALKPYL